MTWLGASKTGFTLKASQYSNTGYLEQLGLAHVSHLQSSHGSGLMRAQKSRQDYHITEDHTCGPKQHDGAGTHGKRRIDTMGDASPETSGNSSLRKRFIPGESTSLDTHRESGRGHGPHLAASTFNELLSGEIHVSQAQTPLILAWALSIHQAKGQTLDKFMVESVHQAGTESPEYLGVRRWFIAHFGGELFIAHLEQQNLVARLQSRHLTAQPRLRHLTAKLRLPKLHTSRGWKCHVKSYLYGLINSSPQLHVDQFWCRTINPGQDTRPLQWTAMSPEW